MATVKVKFRPSTNRGNEGVIFYQIIHDRIVRQYTTQYVIFAHEWNECKSCVVILENRRKHYLQSVSERIMWDVKRLQYIINRHDALYPTYTADDIISVFQQQVGRQSFFNFMQGVIAQLRLMGKQRTTESYASTLSSFMQFREGEDIPLEEIDSDQMLLYEAYLRNRGVAKNSTSFYMRVLRAVYNRAVEKGLMPDKKPFRHVYTGVDKTIKRAIPIKVIRNIKNLDLSLQPALDFARDMFLFSFYTRGMSFVDMAYLKKKDLTDRTLTYRRRKTGQLLTIRWEKCMQEIISKYEIASSEYLLPIINPNRGNERAQYQHKLHQVNGKLKIIGAMAGLHIPLTMYVARHSWASAAKSKNIPISVISEGMGHDSELTTQIYLASLETTAVDKANAQILKDL